MTFVVHFPPSEVLDAARAVAHVLRNAGYEAWFVGGCVRDAWMGENPSDYDIATSARPEVITKMFAQTVPVGVQFGVVMVIWEHIPVEVATFRTESDYTDGRHPRRVCFAAVEEDVKRRDFTVNGLLADPFSGHVTDYVGGIADIHIGCIRCIGHPSDRFQEDRLRILRAIRFAARTGFFIEQETWNAIQKFAHRILDVAIERIRDEIGRILTGPRPSMGFELLQNAGLLRFILPELEQMRGVQQNPNFHPEGDVWNHTLQVLSHLPSQMQDLPEPGRSLLAWAALLHDVGKPVSYQQGEDGKITFYCHESTGAKLASAILTRLRVPTAFTEDVVCLVQDHMRFAHVHEMRNATFKKIMNRQLRFWPDEFVGQRRYFELLVRLLWMDTMASNGDLSIYKMARQRAQALPAGEERPPRLISGYDLKQLGLSPGPLYSKILDAVFDAQLENRVRNRDEAIALARELAQIQEHKDI